MLRVGPEESPERLFISARSSPKEDVATADEPNLRVISVDADRENCGIVQLAARQVEDEANTWQALVHVRNYGTRRQTLRLDMHFGGTAFAARIFSAPGRGDLPLIHLHYPFGRPTNGFDQTRGAAWG